MLDPEYFLACHRRNFAGLRERDKRRLDRRQATSPAAEPSYTPREVSSLDDIVGEHVSGTIRRFEPLWDGPMALGGRFWPHAQVHLQCVRPCMPRERMSL